MNKTLCWYCNKEFEYDGEKYRDVNCPFCGMENSIYNPDKPDWLPPEGYTQNEWLNEEEEMPDINDLKSNLRNEDLKTGDVITFVNAGEIKDIDFSKAQDGSGIKTVLQLLVEIPGGKNKIYTPNATTREILKNAWGKDTENWVGKQAQVTFVKQLAFGEMIEVLVLEPIVEVSR